MQLRRHQQTAIIGTNNGARRRSASTSPASPCWTPPCPASPRRSTYARAAAAAAVAELRPGRHRPRRRQPRLLDPLLEPTVGPILQTIETQVLNPLLSMIGADVSGGTVIMEQIDCQARRLLQ